MDIFMCYALGMGVAVSLSGGATLVRWRGLPRLRLRWIDRVGMATSLYALAVAAAGATCYVCGFA